MSMNKPTGLKYFLYARKSSESEDKQVASIVSQIDELKALAKREGLQIAGIFTEEKSAKAPGRPIFTEMIHRIQAKEAQGIICWKLDRLSRNPIDAGTISWLLQQGVIQHIQTFERSYFPTDSVLMMSFEFGVSNQFLRDLSQNVKRGLRHKIGDGWLPSKVPLGYLNNFRNPSKFPVYKDPERFDLIRKLWDVLLEKRYSILKMTEVAYEIGLRTRKQRKLAKSQVYHILTNPFYCGDFIWQNELYQGKHEPMITKAEFEAAQKIIRSSLRKSRYGCKDFAFTGLIRCGECGAGITAEDKTKHCKNGNTHFYTYYRCSKSVNPKCSQKTVRDIALEEQIKAILGQITIPAEFHQWAMKCLKEDHAKEKQDQEKIREARNNAVKACDKRISSLIDLRVNEEIEPEVFKKRKEELLAEKKKLEELVQDAGYRVETWVNYADSALDLAETAKKRLETGDFETKRDILAALGTTLILKERILSVCLKKPLELIKKVAPEVQPLPANLEPVETLTAQGEQGYSYPPNQKWLGN